MTAKTYKPAHGGRPGLTFLRRLPKEPMRCTPEQEERLKQWMANRGRVVGFKDANNYFP